MSINQQHQQQQQNQLKEHDKHEIGLPNKEVPLLEDDKLFTNFYVITRFRIRSSSSSSSSISTSTSPHQSNVTDSDPPTDTTAMSDPCVTFQLFPDSSTMEGMLSSHLPQFCFPGWPDHTDHSADHRDHRSGASDERNVEPIDSFDSVSNHSNNTDNNNNNNSKNNNNNSKKLNHDKNKGNDEDDEDEATFTFSLTESDGRRAYGFCHRFNVYFSNSNNDNNDTDNNEEENEPFKQECLCLVSKFPWFKMFSTLLSMVQTQRHFAPHTVVPFLRAVVMDHSIPPPGQSISIQIPSSNSNSNNSNNSSYSNYSTSQYTLTRPSDDHLLPLADIELEPLFTALGVSRVLELVACALDERRIVFCSRSISRVSAGAYALTALLYPFSWQHIFIPVLPASLLDYLTAPIPFIVGVHSSMLKEIARKPFEQLVLVDLDAQMVIGSTRDIHLPNYDDLYTPLIQDANVSNSTDNNNNNNNLNLDEIQNQKNTTTDHKTFKTKAVLTSFLYWFVNIFGSYRHAIDVQDYKEHSSANHHKAKHKNNKNNNEDKNISDEFQNKEVDFNLEKFLKMLPKDHAAFVKRFSSTQIFDQFIQERVDLYRKYPHSVPPGMFEACCSRRVPDAYGIRHGKEGPAAAIHSSKNNLFSSSGNKNHSHSDHSTERSNLQNQNQNQKKRVWFNRLKRRNAITPSTSGSVPSMITNAENFSKENEDLDIINNNNTTDNNTDNNTKLNNNNNTKNNNLDNLNDDNNSTHSSEIMTKELDRSRSSSTISSSSTSSTFDQLHTSCQPSSIHSNNNNNNNGNSSTFNTSSHDKTNTKITKSNTSSSARYSGRFLERYYDEEEGLFTVSHTPLSSS